MSDDSVQAIIEKLQNTQNNIKIFTAVPMGVMLILYFFSYAQLVDHGLMAMLVVEIVTTILFVLAFIYLNSWSFLVLKLLYKKRSPYGEIIRQLTAEKIVKSADQLSKEIQPPKTA